MNPLDLYDRVGPGLEENKRCMFPDVRKLLTVIHKRLEKKILSRNESGTPMVD